MTLVLCLLAAHGFALAPELVEWPTDVSASSRGAGAVSFDAAAAGRVDGFELHLRQRSAADVDAPLGTMGAYGTVPVGNLSLYGGFEWGGVPRPLTTRGILGAALQVVPDVWVGLAYRPVWPIGQSHAVSVVDFGAYVEPTSWLTFSAGVDAFNAPDGPNFHVPRALRVGLGLRPIIGMPYLTLAGDARLIGGFDARWITPDIRALVDVSPWEGVHLVGAFQRLHDANAFWGGVGLDVIGANLWGAIRVDNGAQDSALALTVRTRPAESIVHASGRTVEVLLDGELEDPQSGLWPWLSGKAIPTAALRLDTLADDKSVETVVLEIGPLNVGMATVDELRAAIARLRQADKKVVARLRYADDKTYLVAAAANHISLDPLAVLGIDGFSTTHHFFASALQKLGVRFDAVGVGKYKSGPDPLTRDTPRPEDAEVENEILGLAHTTLTESLRKDRHLNEVQVTEVFHHGLFDANAAQQMGLVDDLLPGADPNGVPDRDAPADSYDWNGNPRRRWSTPPVIAVVPVVGTIVPAASLNPITGGSADAKAIVAQIESAAEDSHVVGVVLRVDSPGGDVYASELIWRAIKRLAAHKPVATSMGDVAASGGYYVAAPTHRIFAQANTITGSIGIFSVKPDIHGLLEWIGVHGETYKTSERADWESYEHPLRDDDRERVARTMEAFYGAFVNRVANGRHMPEARVREIAEGRAYTGAHAKELGLVDTLGGLADALRWVQSQAGIETQADVQVAIPDKDVSLPGLLRGAVSADRPLDALITDAQRRLSFVGSRPWAMMPAFYEVGP